MDSALELEGRAPFRERRVSLGGESSASSGGASEGTPSLYEESTASGVQGSFDVSLKSEFFHLLVTRFPFIRGLGREEEGREGRILIDSSLLLSLH